MLPPGTREKVDILGTGAFLPKLLEFCELDQLPSFLGGTGSDTGGVDVGTGGAGMGVRPANKVPVGAGARLARVLEANPLAGGRETCFWRA